MTEKDLDNIYYKIFMKEHYVLVIIPSEEMIYFAQDVGSIDLDLPGDLLIDYDSRKYKLVIEDFQITGEVVFGDERDVEGDLKFWDYECVECEDLILSLATIPKNGKRADIIAEKIELSDIEIVKG